LRTPFFSIIVDHDHNILCFENKNELNGRQSDIWLLPAGGIIPLGGIAVEMGLGAYAKGIPQVSLPLGARDSEWRNTTAE
jgi:hypothetical protein